LKKMKRNKAAGPDEIVTEMLTSLEDFGMEKLTELINKIYNSGEIPKDLSKSIFIVLPKIPGSIACELHRTISFMSHVIKLILKIIMYRAQRKIRREIGKEQCGFMEDTGTRNAIFMIRMLAERAIEMQGDLYLCFIDYTKAFDRVQHEKLLQDLIDLDLDGKDLRFIWNLYWEQTACIRVENELSAYVDIKRGVRQGCVFSPDLFNMYGEKLFRDIDELEGVRVGGYNMNNLRFADDSTLVATSQQGLQDLLNNVNAESKRKGLEINRKKTVCMVISKKQSSYCRLLIGNDQIQQVDKFNYLGSYITESGKCDIEIKRRIELARGTVNRWGKILRHQKMSMSTRMRVVQCYVISTLLYGCESWTISGAMENKLEAAEMWFLRKMQRIPWTDRVTNEEVLKRAGTKKTLLSTIRRRQLEFLRHVVRKEGLENLVLTGKIEGNRDRGRQRKTFLGNLREQVANKWRTDIRSSEILHLARERSRWNIMISNFVRHGT